MTDFSNNWLFILSLSVHTFIVTFIQFNHPTSFTEASSIFFIASSLRGKNLPGVPSRVLNSGLTAGQRTTNWATLHLNWAKLHPTYLISSIKVLYTVQKQTNPVPECSRSQESHRLREFDFATLWKMQYCCSYTVLYTNKVIHLHITTMSYFKTRKTLCSHTKI
jgi:hypothetical protein